jgi:hypothetical protein
LNNGFDDVGDTNEPEKAHEPKESPPTRDKAERSEKTESAQPCEPCGPDRQSSEEHAMLPIRTVLYPTDFSESSKTIANLAGNRPGFNFRRLHDSKSYTEQFAGTALEAKTPKVSIWVGNFD